MDMNSIIIAAVVIAAVGIIVGVCSARNLKLK